MTDSEMVERFKPVSTLADLETLNAAAVLEGYASAERGDPEPGANRGRAFWHGWCNRQRDYGAIPMTTESRALAREYVARRQPLPNPPRAKT